jgi:hypothetical protein
MPSELIPLDPLPAVLVCIGWPPLVGCPPPKGGPGTHGGCGGCGGCGGYGGLGPRSPAWRSRSVLALWSSQQRASTLS